MKLIIKLETSYQIQKMKDFIRYDTCKRSWHNCDHCPLRLFKCTRLEHFKDGMKIEGDNLIIEYPVIKN